MHAMCGERLDSLVWGLSGSEGKREMEERVSMVDGNHTTEARIISEGNL